MSKWRTHNNRRRAQGEKRGFSFVKGRHGERFRVCSSVVLAKLEPIGRFGFDEDHRLGTRSWGLGERTSFPTTEGAEGRNWVD